MDEGGSRLNEKSLGKFRPKIDVAATLSRSLLPRANRALWAFAHQRGTGAFEKLNDAEFECRSFDVALVADLARGAVTVARKRTGP